MSVCRDRGRMVGYSSLCRLLSIRLLDEFLDLVQDDYRHGDYCKEWQKTSTVDPMDLIDPKQQYRYPYAQGNDSSGKGSLLLRHANQSIAAIWMQLIAHSECLVGYPEVTHGSFGDSGSLVRGRRRFHMPGRLEEHVILFNGSPNAENQPRRASRK